MVVGATSWLYERLGRRYPAAFITLELETAYFITAGTLALFALYYDASFEQYLKVLLVAIALTALTIAAVLKRTYPRLRPISDWIGGKRDRESTARAWAAAVGLPLNLIRRDFMLPVFLMVVPACAVAVPLLDLAWFNFFPILFGSLVAMGYAGMLHYLAVEAGMRPVLVDINREVSPRVSAQQISAVPLRFRLLLALPMINLITGLTVAALTSNGGGGASLGLDVLVALLVATTISLELTVLLSKSILRPLADLQRAVSEVGRGNYDVSAPVTTGDELGELAASFNQMVEGLREREQIREAFGTYLDRDVAEYILSEGFTEEGVELEVSMLFCDVRDFTSFAERSNPQQVVGALNNLFEVIVPVIAEHGGHIDKFEGDGLLAVFGAPEPHRDHAERAVRAACEMARRVNHEDEANGLRIGVGVNSGRVIAGSIGGAGRLNFSVIGSAVNLAARVESATRETDDDVLITAETWKELGQEFDAESRGRVQLKGIAEPVSLHAPVVARVEVEVEIEVESEEEAAPARATDGAARRRLAGFRERLRR